MLQEETIDIKKCLDKVEFKNFTISCGVRERKVNGEVAEYTDRKTSGVIKRLLTR